jgi:Ca-activated chloride channel family protein
VKRVVVLVVALALLVTACSGSTTTLPRVHLDDPGRCTPVDVAAAPDVAPVLADVARAFNGSPQSRFGPKDCAFVRVHQVESAVAAQDIVANWPEPDRFGPPPALWVPASSAWSALANERLAARRAAPVAAAGESFARTPLVIAMPAPMAHALGWPATPVGWTDLAQLAANPRGWGARGHPEWGAFKLGKPSPLDATSGLLATIAVSRLGNAPAARALESSVISYGDASWPFLDNWMRLDRTNHSPMTYASAVVTDARSVAAYNTGSVNGTPDPANGKAPHTALVAIAPRDVGGMESDYPLLPLLASWVEPATRPGVDSFIAFARSADAQAKVVAAGFRAGTSSDELALPARGTVTATVDQWQTIRKRARVLLLFDISDSMGDVSDPRDTSSPSKIELAKHDLLNALSELAPDDEVGLRIFTTGITSGPSSDWADLVPIGRLDHNRAALTRAIRALGPRKGSPLYTATRDAYDTVAQKYDPKRINGVVLLTDGYNEDEKNTDLKGLLKHLHDPTRMYTIAYSSAADVPTVRQLAQATNARFYDATDTSQLSPLYVSALSNF